MHLLRVSTEDIEPITIGDAKAQASVFVDADDAFLQAKVRQALEQVAKDTRRSLIDTRWQLNLEKFNRNDPAIKLPRPPLIEVISITYVDVDGALQNIDPAQCQLTLSEVGAWLSPAVGTTWPETQRGNKNAVTITYRAGYLRKEGEDIAGELPPSLREATLLWAAHLYDMREAFVATHVNELPAYGCMIEPFEVDLL